MTDLPIASHTQEALWLAGRILPDPSAHNLLWSLTFRGVLDAARLSDALSRGIARHDALRSVPVWEEGRLVLRTAAPAPVALVPEPASGDLDDAATRFGMAAYDLAAGPLCRFRLVAVAPQEHVLLCGFHHLVMDGSSWPLFAADLLSALRGEALVDLPQTYADHCRWHHAAPEPDDWSEARRYWRSLQAALPPAWQLQLEGDTGDTSQGAAAHSITLAPDLAAALRARAAQWQVSPFRIAFAAWIALLHLETRRELLPVATIHDGRGQDNWPGVVGLFATGGIVLAEISPEMSFRDLADRTETQSAEGERHQRYPSRLSRHEAPPGTQPFEALPVAFTHQPNGRTARCGSLEVSERLHVLPCADRDLCAHYHEEGGTIRLHLVYRTAKFRAGAMSRLAERYRALLADALARPDCKVGALDRLPPQDRHSILHDWNCNDRAFATKPLHELIEAQAARTPQRVALVGPDGALSYGQVNAAANALAHRLIARGVTAGRIVPLLMESSIPMLVAELAVMKAGAAFAPLDPHWPRNRIDRILTRLDADLVLTETADEAALVGPVRETLCVAHLDTESRAGNPRIARSTADPIYCIFTSGSTGEPKGAVNAHRGVVNRLLSMTETFGSPADDTILATASAMADTHVWQYFWALTGGGRVVVMPRVQVVSPARIVELMRVQGITFSDFIPSIFQKLVAHLKEHPGATPAFARLRWLLLGGEAMNAGDSREFQQRVPHVALCNTYGPTETSIGALFHKLPAPFAEPIPIGRPFPNIRAVILDTEGRLAPVGTIGELCLGGDCVGLGYLGNPEATAAKFIANPFPELGCDRLYRTGDLARFRPDGLIDYLGREDHQIKIRGARIEPGEVEAALVRHPSVAQAVVSRDESGTALVAHLVAAAGKTPEAALLREALRADLPVHMIPARFVLVAALPLTAGGKIDRTALHAVQGQPLPLTRGHVAPRDETERRLVAIWESVLQRAGIGIHDNFFADLGGESLKALLVVAGLQEAGLTGDIRALYETQTIAALAARLSGRSALGEPPARIGTIIDRQRPYLASWSGDAVSPGGLLFKRNASGRRPPLFWCFQGAVEFQQLALHLGPEQPLIGMRSGHLIMDYDDASLDTIAARYVQEMLAIQPKGAIRLGGNCQGGRIAHRVAQHLARIGRDVALLIQMEESVFPAHDGRVALIFGRESKFNPYPEGDPTVLFEARYPQGYSVDIVPGAHGQFFQDRHVAALARAIAGRLAQPALSRGEAA